MYITIKEVPKGDFVKRKDTHNKVYRKGEYDRSLKGYWLLDCGDISRAILVKSSKLVFTDFEY
jgi:hypothetical protein